MQNNFGKKLGYEVTDCEVKVSFEKQDAYFTVVRDEIIRVYVPFFDDACQSKAIEKNPCVDADFTVEQDGEAVVISTEKSLLFWQILTKRYQLRKKGLKKLFSYANIKTKINKMSFSVLWWKIPAIAPVMETECIHNPASGYVPRCGYHGRKSNNLAYIPNEQIIILQEALTDEQTGKDH